MPTHKKTRPRNKPAAAKQQALHTESPIGADCTAEEAFVIMERTLKRLPDLIAKRISEIAPPGAGATTELMAEADGFLAKALRQCAVGLFTSSSPCDSLLQYCRPYETIERIARDAFQEMQNKIHELCFCIGFFIQGGNPKQRRSMFAEVSSLVAHVLRDCRRDLALGFLTDDDVQAAKKVNLRRVALKTLKAEEAERRRTFGA